MARSEQLDHRRRKEATQWDKFWAFVKVNEKVFWVILLVLISFSFAFPTGQTLFSGSGRSGPVLKIFNKVIYDKDRSAAVQDVDAVSSIRGGPFGDRREGGLDWRDYLLFQAEADRLGIVISDEELGAEIRRIYWALRAQDDAFSNLPVGSRVDQQAQFTFRMRVEELRKLNAWDYPDWVRLFTRASERRRGAGISPNHFESMLRSYMKAEKAVDYARQSAEVTENDVRQEFLKQEQLRRLAFFEVKPDPKVREEIAAKITEAEVAKYYNDNLDAFRIGATGPKLRVGYYYVPFEVFEKQVQLTEEDIRKEYDRTKNEKYAIGLNADESGFELLSPAEIAQRDEKLYKPLDAVRADVIKDLTASKSKELTRKVADEIKAKLQPSPAPAAPGAAATPPPQPTATLAEVQQLHPYLKAGTTEWFTKAESLEKLGAMYAYQVGNWFTSADKYAKELDESKRLRIPTADFWQDNTDKDGLVLFHDLKVRYPGLSPLSEVGDEARSLLAKSRALDVVRAKADALAQEAREGKKTLEQAAQEVGSQVRETPFLKRFGSIQVPDPAPKKKTADAGDEPSRPATKPHPGDDLILGEAFAIAEDGKVGYPVRDEKNESYYIVRLVDKMNPPPEELKNREKYLRQQLTAERQKDYFLTYRKDLWARAGVEAYTMADSGEKQ